MLLKSITYRKQNKDEYPFNIPLIKSFTSLSFTAPVTIFVGENGTGKSTLLEAIASSAGAISIGRQNIEQDDFLSDVQKLANCLKLTWTIKTKNGFFLRSEDFLGYIRRLSDMRKEAERNLAEINETYKDKSAYAKGLASMPHYRTLHDLKNLYGDGLEHRSHGEGYLDFFGSRFRPNGLYLLDEPEIPLSPMKQLSFISMLKEMVEENAQFIIATHSPILMAFPEAEIINFDTLPPAKTTYEDLEHVQLTKSFLENPERYLRHL